MERARIFTKNCKALFPKRRITTTVFNDEGIQILVIRYIKALNPPQQLLDMFLHDSNARLVSDIYVSNFIEIFTYHIICPSKVYNSVVFNISFHFILGTFLMAQVVKNSPAMWETWVRSLGWEDPLGKGKATHSDRKSVV